MAWACSVFTRPSANASASAVNLLSATASFTSRCAVARVLWVASDHHVAVVVAPLVSSTRTCVACASTVAVNASSRDATCARPRSRFVVAAWSSPIREAA